MFLYIDPLKQGLKRFNIIIASSYLLFLYIDPLKQGLKQFFPVNEEGLEKLFLYIDPLKQGLKLKVFNFTTTQNCCFYT